MITVDKYGKHLHMENCINHKTGLLKTGFFRLEFSEKQQHFHLNRGTRSENTHGWVTICEVGEDRFLSKFTEYMRWKYGFCKENPVPLKAVLKEFECYKWIVRSANRF